MELLVFWILKTDEYSVELIRFILRFVQDLKNMIYIFWKAAVDFPTEM